MRLQTLSFATLGVIGLGLGYFLGGADPGPQREDITAEGLAEVPAHRLAPPQSAETPAASPPATRTVASVPSLDGIFGESTTGKALREVTLLYSFRSSNNAEGRALNAHLESLLQNPKEALEDLRNGLDRLPAQYAEQRQFWIQFASLLKVEPEAKVEFLKAEILRPFDGTSQGILNAPIAMESLYSATQDAALVEATLRDALRVQTNPGVREILVSRFSNINPKSAQLIRQELGI